MAIEEFYARSEADVVTFSNGKLRFSASLVKKIDLNNFQYTRIGVDTELRRIYFAFQSEAAPGLPKLYAAKKEGRKFVAVGKLSSKYDWIDSVFKQKDPAKKQFVLEEVDPTKKEIYPKYKFFVTIGYSWSSDRDFHDVKQYPEEPGVYRLKKDTEVARIGESNNIAARLQAHLKEYGTQVDTFDFEIVPNDDERKEEQKRLLKSYKDNVGKLPKLNPITN
jgi:hypothetical protein